jgi:hypothetical protein
MKKRSITITTPKPDIGQQSLRKKRKGIAMFYPVSVLDPKNKLVEIISSKKLSARHWRAFKKKFNEKKITKSEKPRRRRSK